MSRGLEPTPVPGPPLPPPPSPMAGDSAERTSDTTRVLRVKAVSYLRAFVPWAVVAPTVALVTGLVAYIAFEIIALGGGIPPTASDVWDVLEDAIEPMVWVHGTVLAAALLAYGLFALIAPRVGGWRVRFLEPHVLPMGWRGVRWVSPLGVLKVSCIFGVLLAASIIVPVGLLAFGLSAGYGGGYVPPILEIVPVFLWISLNPPLMALIGVLWHNLMARRGRPTLVESTGMEVSIPPGGERHVTHVRVAGVGVLIPAAIAAVVFFVGWVFLAILIPLLDIGRLYGDALEYGVQSVVVPLSAFVCTALALLVFNGICRLTRGVAVDVV